ncbi:MAG: hypothetical protein AAFX99_25430, partial [Myxococcota bacterium]
MKVGLIIYGDLNTRSGGYLYDRRLIEHLRAAGDTVELIQLPWRSWLQHLTDNISPSLWRRILQMDLDILLQDELNHPSLVLPNTLERLQQQRQWPILSIVHHLRCCEPEHPWWARNLYEAVERAYLATVDGFIFNSHVTRSEVEARTPPRPHVVAWPGGDRLGALAPDDIRPRALRPGPLQLLFIGNITPRKGLHTLLDALSTLPYDLWRLHVVGSTAVAPEYMRRIRSQIAPMRDSITADLPDDGLAVAARLACVQGMFRVDEVGRLTPLDLQPDFRLPPSLVYGAKYRGKTHELVTQLALNVAVAHCRTGSPPQTLLDPMAGRGTTLLWGLRYGLHGRGIEQDQGALDDLHRHIKRQTKLHRIKHEHHK